MERKVQFRLNLADAFFGLLNYKINQYEKAAATKYFKTFNFGLTPAFCQYYVPVAQLKYTKNLYKNWIFRKFKYARKEKFYAPVICFG